MHEVREGLIAARSLIDTPEKWSVMKGVVISVAQATRGASERTAVIAELRKQGLLGGEPLPVILAAFDRAISKVGVSYEPS